MHCLDMSMASTEVKGSPTRLIWPARRYIHAQPCVASQDLCSDAAKEIINGAHARRGQRGTKSFHEKVDTGVLGSI